MLTLTTEVAIIGAGSAGILANREAIETTDDVLLIEDGPYDITSAHVGCMPSRLPFAAAKAASARNNTSAMDVTYVAPQKVGLALNLKIKQRWTRT